MKIAIALNLVDGPYGGAHQFLGALKGWLRDKSFLADDVSSADVVLFNSSQEPEVVLRAKYMNPKAVFIHRIDGSSKLYNSPSDKRDDISSFMNDIVADGIIYQSQWASTLGVVDKGGVKPSCVIRNAPNPDWFFGDGEHEHKQHKKLKLISTSWSSNWKKGFATYKWMDEHLDWSRYEMTFVGNSPVDFKNIQIIKPVAPKELGVILREHDVFVFASEKEACSNALLEAMHCGLPVVALNDGGNPELVEGGGELFDKKEELPDKLDSIAKQFETIKSRIRLESLDDVGSAYVRFFKECLSSIDRYESKKLPLLKYLWARVMVRHIRG